MNFKEKKKAQDNKPAPHPSPAPPSSPVCKIKVKEGEVGEGRRSLLETWGELEKSQATSCITRSLATSPQPREALTQGSFPLKPPFASPQPAPPQRSRGTEDECKPVVMEMPVAQRSASALESPQTHFRFRRFGTNTKILLSTQSSHEGEPTNGVTGLGRGAIDCGDETERCCRRWWTALKFQTIQPFPISSFFMPIKSAVSE